ncbi:MAG: isoamylase early set domain-containing protein [Myxococcota bacterium]|jgi:1,4-alpha-glucan branching enzyme|nr:isoamylase early set domain-containing protein [Myxococcota bacterium]
MLKKTYTSSGSSCRVTFKVPNESSAQEALVLGDFNDWTPGKTMRTLKDGSFSQTIHLDAGQSYRFRYLLDGQTWENDGQADCYQTNPFGGTDGVVEV